MFSLFTSITYLQSGNDKQQKVYDVLNKLNIMEDLALYSPVLCGTIPIRIDTLQSDLDIVMEVHNFDVFEQEMRSLYGSYEGFKIKKKKIKNTESIKVNFNFEGFEFELFAQPKPVRNQNAYRHMIVEHMHPILSPGLSVFERLPTYNTCPCLSIDFKGAGGGSSIHNSR